MTDFSKYDTVLPIKVKNLSAYGVEFSSDNFATLEVNGKLLMEVIVDDDLKDLKNSERVALLAIVAEHWENAQVAGKLAKDAEFLEAVEDAEKKHAERWEDAAVEEAVKMFTERFSAETIEELAKYWQLAQKTAEAEEAEKVAARKCIEDAKATKAEAEAEDRANRKRVEDCVNCLNDLDHKRCFNQPYTCAWYVNSDVNGRWVARNRFTGEVRIC